MLIDTHAHLTMDPLAADVPGVLTRAGQAGVVQVITVGTDAEDSRRAVDLAQAHEGVWAAVGVHPHEAGPAVPQVSAVLGEHLRRPKVVAIGEIGLDYHYNFSDRPTQQRVLKAQLAVAGDFDLPLVVHCREAVADTVSILHEAGFAGRRVVFHCFTGTAEEAQLLADHGWRVSFTGIVTFRSAVALQAIARMYPAEQLMLETDAPYLSPVPRRHVRPNEPALLQHTAAFLARLRGEPLEELAAQTTQNAAAFFRLPVVS